MFGLKKLSVLICCLISFSFFNCVNAYDKFAKVVFIGRTGSGKTVLYNLLTPSNKEKSIGDTEHSIQLSTEKVPYNIDGKSVCVYFGDTSGEPKHQDLMEAFCHNAHVVFIMLDAEQIVKAKLRPQLLPSIFHPFMFSNSKEDEKSFKYLEDLIGYLYKYAPGCRVVVVMTKMGKIEKIYEHEDNKKWRGAQSSIKHYVEDLSFIVEGNLDETYDLTLFDYKSPIDLKTKSKDQIIGEMNTHRGKLENIIKECLRKYGIDKLPDTPDGFRAEVVKEIVGYKKVVDEEAGTCSSEKSHIETKYEDKLYVK